VQPWKRDVQLWLAFQGKAWAMDGTKEGKAALEG